MLEISTCIFLFILKNTFLISVNEISKSKKIHTTNNEKCHTKNSENITLMNFCLHVCK